ncbi:MAG: AraC family transcriptional regulator ligand-binding domain-containing protein [Lysobacterales bacterium]
MGVRERVQDAAAPNDPARRAALSESVNLAPDAPVNAKLMVSDTDYYGLCERAAREDDEGTRLPIRVGRSMRCDDYGAFGLAWKTAPNLGASYARPERYGLVLTSVSTYQVIREDNHTLMVLNRDGVRDLGLCCSGWHKEFLEQNLSGMKWIFGLSGHMRGPLMVVSNLNIESVTAFPTKHYPPLVIDTNGMVALWIAP